MNQTVLALLAHPDDIEFLCAGTLLRLQDLGWSLRLATMTAGDCGSVEYSPEDIARIRRAEAEKAAHLVGATYDWVGERDLRVGMNENSLERVVQLLCAVRPSLVITHSPEDYHPDHEMTSKLVRTATFAAPAPNFLFGRWKSPPLEQIPHLYYCDPVDGKDIFGKPLPPGFLVDISAKIDLKEKLLACHASQRDWLFKHHGVDDYLKSMRNWSAKQGTAGGVAYAEGFRQHLGHSYPQNNLVGELLGTVGGS